VDLTAKSDRHADGNGAEVTDIERETGTIWWVRHGPTHAKGMVGWSDLPADLSGRCTLDRLFAALPADAEIVSSDLSRAVATADAVAGGRRRLAHEPDLREMNFGDWELKRHDDLEATDPERIRAFWTDPASVRPPGGELWSEMSVRVEATVLRLLESHARLIVVAHFGTILSQAARAAGWSGRDTFAQRVEPLSLTRIDYGPTRRLAAINQRP
jgi:alpha-ribazole phosphatase